jgi:anti-sigma factor RsiW
MTAEIHPISPEELMAYLDGESPVEEACSLESHIKSCFECRSLALELRSVSASLMAWRVNDASASLSNPILEQGSKTESSRFFGRASRYIAWKGQGRWVVPAAALGCALFFFLAITAYRRSLYPMSVPAALATLRSKSASENGFQQYAESRSAREQQLDAALAQYRTLNQRLQQQAISSNLEQPTPSPRGAGIVGGNLSTPFPEPMIARSATLSIVVKDFVGARSKLDAIVERHHGYAAQLTSNSEQNAARSLQASLRIPTSDLAAAITELKSLGAVQNETQSGEEVTQQHADLEARLKNSRETEHRLQAILEQRTGRVSDVLAVEQEIARVRGEIELMEAELASLGHRVAFATLDVTISEEYKAQMRSPISGTWTQLQNAVVKGLREAGETILGLAIFLLERGPSFLVWLALLLPIGWFFWRRWRRNYPQAVS